MAETKWLSVVKCNTKNVNKLGYGETGLKFDFHDMAQYFCDMFLIKKIYLPTLRPIIADSYWAINSLFFTSFAIITDETQIFHPPWYFPCFWFLDRGHFIQWKINGEKALEPIAAISLAWIKSIMKTSPNFNYLPCRYFWRAERKFATLHIKDILKRADVSVSIPRNCIHYGILTVKSL